MDAGGRIRTCTSLRTRGNSDTFEPLAIPGYATPAATFWHIPAHLNFAVRYLFIDSHNEEHIMQLGKYKHYKGKLYEVIGVARHSETLEEMVVYKALYESEFGKDTLWVRPKVMFLETVTVDGKEVPRFTFLGKSEYFKYANA